MNPAGAVGLVVGLVAVATALGLVWRARTGKVTAVAARVGGADSLVPADLNTGEPFGAKATLVQFSTEYCAPCKPTRRVLTDLATTRPGVAYLDIDLTEQPELARRFNVLQTPTILVLDGSGAIRARIGGAPRQDDLRTELDTIVGGPHATAV